MSGSNGSTDAERKLRVVAVEDHVALRKGMELLFEREGFHVAGAAGDAAQAYDLIRATRPDVAVVDIALPGESGVELTKRVLEVMPELGILLYTGSEDSKVLRAGLACGARGFVLKAGSPEELMRVARIIAAGGEYVDPQLNRTILGRDTLRDIDELSPREQEMLYHLAQGLTGEQIAQRLFISPETVRTHVRNAMTKLEAHTRSHAVAIALRQGDIALQ